MVWHIEYECFSLLLVLIVMFNFFNNSFLPTLQNQMYRYMLFCTCAFISLNILGTICLANSDKVPILLTNLFNQLYLLFLPFLPAMVCLYVMAIIYDDLKPVMRFVRLLSLPLVCCFVLVLSNPLTHLMFRILPLEGYVRGVGYFFTFGTFYFYSIVSFILTLKYHKRIPPAKLIGIRSFLVISFVTIILQALFMDYLLTGAACACSILIMYLTMQNKGLIIDDLTGGFNRSAFTQILESKIRLKKSGCVVTVSMDDFKFVNETFGTKNGDLFLHSVCQYLKTRVSDGSVYRISGDMFSIILEGKQLPDVETMVDEIMAQSRKPWTLAEVSCLLSISIGVVYYPQNAETVEEITTATDFAVHIAKLGNGRVVVYADAELQNKIKRKHQIKIALKRAIAHDGFEVYYQPIFNVTQQRFTSAEALARLNDPELGFIPPDEFIPIAEETGLIINIGVLIFEKVCHFIATHHYLELGFDAIAVNLSVVQCMQENISGNLIAIAEKYQVPHQALRLEITESASISSMKTLKAMMATMEAQDFQFSLDDFGSGYSGLAYIQQLNFQKVKVDKSLLWSAQESEREGKILSIAIAMIKDLDMLVVVEGVETADHVRLLTDLKCDYLQGYYFSKPLPEEAFSQLVQKIG